MNKCKLCSNLLPVGNEVFCASENEARYFFARQGLAGIITLVIILNSNEDEDADDIFGWLLTDENYNFRAFLSVFAPGFDINANPETIEKLSRGSVFTFQKSDYQVTWNKDLGIHIRQIGELHHQQDLEIILTSMGYTDLTFYLCKIFSIEKKPQMLGYSWIVYSEPPTEDWSIFTYPLFRDDGKKLSQWTFEDIRTETLEPNSILIHDKKVWRVKRTPDGKLYLQSGPGFTK